MQKARLLERIALLTTPIEPIPFDHPTYLTPLPNIKSVAFDFYGTMFISGVGDISVDEEQKSSYAGYFKEALCDSRLDIQNPSAGATGLKYFEKNINDRVARKKAAGIDHPEPNILAVWDDVLTKLKNNKQIDGSIKKSTVLRFAIEFEFRANPIWPVPDLKNILHKLLEQNLMLGIISNSQFYTPLAFEALMGASPTAFGFEKDLLKWSYYEGIKKPSLKFYRRFQNELPEKHMRPSEVLYVGNDLNKDITPAAQAGFKTALYVGDKRSLRHVEEDLQKSSIKPDIIISDLAQINECLHL